MAAQGRGWGDAEDVIEAIGATPVENLGTAIVAVGPQQDLVGVTGDCRSTVWVLLLRALA